MSGVQQNTLMASGSGGRAYFRFNKSLSSDIGSAIAALEEHFHQTFDQIKVFQEKLDMQRGKASTTLKRNLNKHIELLSKIAPAILYFSDVTKSLLLTLEATDQDDNTVVIPTERMQWKYSFSAEQITEEVQVDSCSMLAGLLIFKDNLMNIDELLIEFTKLINKVNESSIIPWGDFHTIWAEAKYMCEGIIEELKNQMEKLIKDTETFMEEIIRLDHMAAHHTIQV